MTSELHRRLEAAHARIQRGNDERAAGADDKARAIADEAACRGRGGPKQLADELGVSEKTISQAIARARNAPSSPSRTLPPDTLERLLAAELETLPLLLPVQWEAVAWIVRGTIIDAMWIEQPGEFLAQEVEDAELDEAVQPAALAETCRGLSRVQALAVIDTCQRNDLTVLPVKKQAP
ncbi:hypothetical protein PZ61_0237955 [Streptomyces sp. MNU77]|uniref:hypothetical protein n=1 Tax=Streptomyces sp. MNU77 TaxID=1573406 RepID=UPI0005E5AC59|nr:hypothetical protein [Streptomyces sp. MNU77]OLO25472.1 hypothetical protein PZ61_0237955 [Streptomyces sp. MNU77]